MRSIIFFFVTGCSSASIAADAGDAGDAATSEAGDGSSDGPGGSCKVGTSCGFDCLPSNGPFWACGSPIYDSDCSCRATRTAGWPDCSAPGPVGEGEFCGNLWWCNRACTTGLVCAPIPNPNMGGDYRTTCQKAPTDAGAD